jgi:hypothetical protein
VFHEVIASTFDCRNIHFNYVVIPFHRQHDPIPQSLVILAFDRLNQDSPLMDLVCNDENDEECTRDDMYVDSD